MSISQISVVIIAKNAQDTILEALAALHSFDEVVLYLNDSTDQTKTIAQSYPNVKIIEGNFIGFGETKNFAANYTSKNWILSLDSDEILNDKLINEIDQLDFEDETKLYRLKRDNYFLGKRTISQDVIIRLYHKEFTSFDAELVHEKIKIPRNSKSFILNNSFKHLNITNINQTLFKMIKYTDLGAEKKKTCFFIIVILKALFAFIQTYFIRLYFLDGWRGFVIAVSNANRRFYRYLKQYINCQQL